MASHHADASTGGPAARFGILGPLDVRGDNGAAILVGPQQNRRVLATLLLFAGAPCTSSFLTQAIWGQQPPGNPRHSLHEAVYELRRCLGTSRERLESSEGGYSYKFAAGAAEVDAALFNDLARQGRRAWYSGETGRAAGLLSAAARLWQDPVLADVPQTPILAEIRDTLIRARLDVEELWMDARLKLGGHHEAIDELYAWVHTDPLREHVWAQLMLALYRDGRTAKALRAYCDAQDALQAEYGCAPGPELTEIRRHIAAGSPDLLAGGAGLVPRPAAGAAAVGKAGARLLLIAPPSARLRE
jgi:DNA-binding SARP family transcriptional activator